MRTLLRSYAVLAAVLLAGGLAFALGSSAAATCPAGFVPVGGKAGADPDHPKGEADREGGGVRGCLNRKHPESFSDLMAANQHQAARVTAPAGSVRTGAYASAIRQRDRIDAAGSTLPGSGGTWTPAGKGPLIADDSNFAEVNGEGLADLAGRTNDFAYDAAGNRLYAAVGEGGVWESGDMGKTWRSIGDGLPVQAIGSLGYSSAQGGTVIAVTGDDVFGGGGTFAGLGVWRTTDDGAHWTQATGVPSGVNGYKIAVDPANANVVYAATGAGLFRSTDDGATFTNVNLPVGSSASGVDCTGALPTKVGCYLANQVTDVVVQQPGGTGTAGHKVVAAVGWRAGDKTNTAVGIGTYKESPGNGLYSSTDGTTFTHVTDGAFSPDVVGRIELGKATGPDQDHNFLYAIVQDPTAFQGGGEAHGIDAPGAGGVADTYLSGIYVSSDFGTTWTRLEGATALTSDPNNDSQLTGTACSGQQYCPGVQAWYNDWIAPDPTQADSAGAPTRVVFGLEELFENRPVPQGGPVDGSVANTARFHAIGPYFAGSTCLFLSAGLPYCPTSNTSNGQTTTHPDQHGGLFVPGASGSVTLVAGNDGGVYTQTAAAGADFSNAGWGRGANQGFHTLLPYDAQVAKDGTIWAGLQDNGELKITPEGKQFMTFGGDGGFDMVVPDHSDVAYEGLDGGSINLTTDGGKNWNDVTPPSDNYQFTNPFVMDPANPAHVMTAGTKVWEASDGPTTPGSGQTPTWASVFDLGTGPAPDNPPNQMSAIDVRGTPAGQPLPSGPHTPDFSYSGGGGTFPGGSDPTGTGNFIPGTYEDHPFTITPDEGDATANITVSWADGNNDWDLYLYKKDGSGNLQQVGSSAQGSPTTSENVTLSNPEPGDYVIRVANFAASGTFDARAAFAQRAGGAQAVTDAAYVGFCGYCEPLNHRPFQNGIATNVGGDKPPKAGTGDGWHIAKANGLPNRYITSVQVDPSDPRTVYVTLAGYSRRWLPVGAIGEGTPNVGTGHVFKSTDAGQSFTDVSGNLPDVPADWTVVRNGQLVVGTDIGAFISAPSVSDAGQKYEVLGSGLPTAPVFTMELKPKSTPDEPDKLVVATQGRGVYTYEFKDQPKTGEAKPPPAQSAATACAASAGFRSAQVKPHGRTARFAFTRRVSNPVTVDVFQSSQGRRIVKERLVARFSKKTKSFTWNGRRTGAAGGWPTATTSRATGSRSATATS